jgi:hypothetical protein
MRVLGHPQFLLRAFVGRGSPDPAQVPDRRSPSFGVCAGSANAFEASACDDRGRPAVVHSGGVVRPAPNTENAALTGESAQRNRDERRTAAIPTFHHPRVRQGGPADRSIIPGVVPGDSSGPHIEACLAFALASAQEMARHDPKMALDAGVAGARKTSKPLRDHDLDNVRAPRVAI